MICRKASKCELLLRFNPLNLAKTACFTKWDKGLSVLLEGGNPIARHHGKGLERATFCHGVELSYCLVTVRALTETWYQECEQTLIILLLSI